MSPDSKSELKEYPAGNYARVELFGHQTVWGRVSEVEAFGAKMCAIEPILAGKLLPSFSVGGAAIYRITPVDAGTAFGHAPTEPGWSKTETLRLLAPTAKEITADDVDDAHREYNSEHPDHPDYEDEEAKPIVLEEGEEIVDHAEYEALVNVAQAACWLLHRIDSAREPAPNFEETKALFGELETQINELKKHYKDLQADTYAVYDGDNMVPKQSTIAEAAATQVAGMTADAMLQTAYGALPPDDEPAEVLLRKRIRELIEAELKLHDGKVTPAVVKEIVARVMKEWPVNEGLIRVTADETQNVLHIELPRGYFFDGDPLEEADDPASTLSHRVVADFKLPPTPARDTNVTQVDTSEEMTVRICGACMSPNGCRAHGECCRAANAPEDVDGAGDPEPM